MSGVRFFFFYHAKPLRVDTNCFSTQFGNCEDGGLDVNFWRGLRAPFTPSDYLVCSPKRSCIESVILTSDFWPSLIDFDIDKRNYGKLDCRTFRTRDDYINAVKNIELSDHIGIKNFTTLNSYDDWEDCESILVRVLRAMTNAYEKVMKLRTQGNNITRIVFITHRDIINVALNFFNDRYLGLHNYQIDDRHLNLRNQNISYFTGYEIPNVIHTPNGIECSIRTPRNTFCPVIYSDRFFVSRVIHKIAGNYLENFKARCSEDSFYATYIRETNKDCADGKTISFNDKVLFTALIGAQRNSASPIREFPISMRSGVNYKPAQIQRPGFRETISGYLIETNDEHFIHKIAEILEETRYTVLYNPKSELNKKIFSVTYTRSN